MKEQNKASKAADEILSKADYIYWETNTPLSDFTDFLDKHYPSLIVESQVIEAKTITIRLLSKSAKAGVSLIRVNCKILAYLNVHHHMEPRRNLIKHTWLYGSINEWVRGNYPGKYGFSTDIGRLGRKDCVVLMSESKKKQKRRKSKTKKKANLP